MGDGSSQLGEAFVPIRLTLEKLDSDLDAAKGKISGALSKIGGSVQKIGKIAVAGILGGVAAIGTGFIAVASQAVPAASNLNEALNATSVVFGDAADIVQDFGKTAAESAGLSESAFNQLAATTGAMLQNYGLDSDTAAQSTVELAQRAADMASIFNTDVDEALGAINAAMRGEADPIERFGVSMSAAAVQAKAMEMGLADSTAELDNAALTQARLALLFEQTDAIAGDFVNTSDQLANATRVQQARWENFMAKIGGFALPILQTFQGVFMDIGERVMPIVIDAIAPFAEIIGNVAASIGDFVTALMDGADPLSAFSDLIYNISTSLGLTGDEAAGVVSRFQEFVAQVQDVIANIWLLIEPIVSSITSFVSWQDVLVALGIAILTVIIPAVASLVASMLPIILTVAAIVGAVALLRNAWENDWGGIRTSLTAWWEETGKPIFDQLRAWLSENLPIAIQTLKDFWSNVLQPAIEAVWAFLSNVLIPFLSGTVFPWLKEKLTAAIQALANYWTNTLRPAIEAVWSWMSTVLIPFLTDVLFPWLSEKLTAAIQTLSDFWTNTLKPALDVVWSFIKDDLVPLFEALWELFNVAGTLALQALAGIWENTLKPALEKVWSFIKTDLVPIFESIVRVINEDLAPPLEWLASEVLGGLESAFKAVKDAIQFVIDKIKQLIEKLGSISLPKEFTPGSPTPFEIGLRGINDALGEFNKLIDKNSLITGPSVQMNPVETASMSGLNPESQSQQLVSYSPETNIYTNREPLQVLRASRHLDRLAEIPS